MLLTIIFNISSKVKTSLINNENKNRLINFKLLALGSIILKSSLKRNIPFVVCRFFECLFLQLQNYLFKRDIAIITI